MYTSLIIVQAAPETGLRIDWTTMPTYNTVMAVAAGAGLIMLVLFARELLRSPGDVIPESWALAFGAVGMILTTTGLHMTLTWPLAVSFPFDNIIFGEPSLAFGVLLSAAALYLWRHGAAVLAREDAVQRLARTARPVSVFVVGMGLGLFAIAVAGVRYQLFAAPVEEPISGAFADYPMVEAVFVSGLYALVGLGAVLFPRVLKDPDRSSTARSVVGWSWAVAGLVFLLFGAMNFFTHIGLIVNTM
jgi:uncharacterized membrane protein